MHQESALSGYHRLALVPVLVACMAVPATPRASAPARDGAADSALQQALGILDYVAGDYAGAVDGAGRVRHAEEYAEQKRLLRRAEKLLVAALPAGQTALLGEMRALRIDCGTRRPPAQFVPRLRRLHQRIVHDLDVALTPHFVPSLAAGRIVYAQSCAVCHGEDGSAHTLQAAALDPPPTDFRDPELATRLSPYLAFNLVTYGVPGTAMASFEALADDERWAVAFWVLALRHPQPAAVAAPARGGDVVSPTLHQLVVATDADLRARLRLGSDAERDATVARWRWQLPLEIGD
jgi:high-affinity iron transporter